MLLDDCDASVAAPTSRLLTRFVCEHRCEDPARLDAVCAAVDADLKAGLHGFLLADYEWGVRLAAPSSASTQCDSGALRVLMFAECERMSGEQVEQLLAAPAVREGTVPAASGFFGWKAEIENCEFDEAVAQIQQLIRAGETYQVNYTYRMRGWAHGNPVGLYGRLRARQPVPFGALIRLPGGQSAEYVLSLSPELFLSFDGEQLLARPMKGTAAAPDDQEQRAGAAAALASDTKNRAENVMIVDLVRNDLGRLAKTGSVRVPRLFEVARHGRVLQMTSDVVALPRDDVGLADVLRATFPCGSVTGAPKIKAIEAISRLEASPRGAYCGAIGWLSASRGGMGPFCLSVAIRTIMLGRERNGVRRAQFGVGSGIVADSNALAERRECELKSEFVAALDAGFELLETMYVVGGQIPLLEQHLCRLRRSSMELGFDYDDARVRREVEGVADALGPGEWRLRAALRSNGALSTRTEMLSGFDPESLTLIGAPLSSEVPRRLVRHKTTLRQHYDEGVRRAIDSGAFDTLFHTPQGRLVDGGRSTLLLLVDGAWFTPEVCDGALPGVARSTLLECGLVQERSLHLSDLRRAAGMAVCNAVRGVAPVSCVDRIRFDVVPRRMTVPQLAQLGCRRRPGAGASRELRLQQARS